MFPNGWPGRGLLLLRITVFSFIAFDAFQMLGSANRHGMVIPGIIALTCAALVLLGLSTPFAAIALSLCEVWIAASPRTQWQLPVCLCGISLSLAMLGPGSLSVDAQLFGRKRIDISST